MHSASNERMAQPVVFIFADDFVARQIFRLGRGAEMRGSAWVVVAQSFARCARPPPVALGGDGEQGAARLRPSATTEPMQSSSRPRVANETTLPRGRSI